MPREPMRRQAVAPQAGAKDSISICRFDNFLGLVFLTSIENPTMTSSGENRVILKGETESFLKNRVQKNQLDSRIVLSWSVHAFTDAHRSNSRSSHKLNRNADI
jgi:hypothetical protein